MTETPQQDREDQDQVVTDRVHTENLRDYSLLRRSLPDRVVAGVAGGLGRHLNIDPTILRVTFVVLCFFGGAGFVLYGAAWLLVPEDGQEKGKVTTSPTTRNTLLIVAAVLAAFLLVGDSWGGFGFPWPLALIAVVAFVVLMNRDTPVRTQTAPPAVPGARETGGHEPAPKPDRGPRLFATTLALVAVALGSLGLYETAGGSVTDAAYPALALGVIGVMLVIGAWVGRAGGLILLGVVAAIALAISSSIGPRFEGGQRTIDATPTGAGQVRDSYYVPAGSIALDLTDIRDIDSLDGRQIDLEANAGEIVVTVPDGVDLDVTADVSVAGEAVVLGREMSGPNVHLERQVSDGADAPEIELDIRLLVGRIEVR